MSLAIPSAWCCCLERKSKGKFVESSPSLRSSSFPTNISQALVCTHSNTSASIAHCTDKHRLLGCRSAATPQRHTRSTELQQSDLCQRVQAGDVIYIEANSGAVKRIGRCDAYATEFDLEAEEYVPMPKVGPCSFWYPTSPSISECLKCICARSHGSEGGVRAWQGAYCPYHQASCRLLG